MSDSKTILLVEDEALIAVNEKRLLTKEGYHVRHILTGEAAIEAICAKDEPFDMVLMDINLGPGMDGVQAARQILQTHDIPIIFLSSHSEDEVIERIEQITSYGYVAKDSAPIVLVPSIRMAFKLHKAHMQLQESEHRYRTLVEYSPDCIAIEQDGKIVYVNAAAVKLAQVNGPEDLIGTSFTDHIFPRDLPAVMERAQALEKNRQPLPAMEEHYIIHNNDQVILDVSPTPIIFNGRPAVQMIGHNITLHKKAEIEREALLVQVTTARDEAAKAKDQFYSVMERVSDGIVAFDKDFNYTYVNAYGGELLGRNAEDLIGKNYWMEYPEARGTPFANAYVSAMETQQTIVFEDYYVHWNRWFSNRIYPSKDGITIFFNDITDRKRVEENLQQRNEEYRTLVENSPDVITRFDKQYRHIFVNPAVEKEWGVPPKALIGKSLRELGQPPEQADWSEGLIRQVFQTGQEVIFELENPAPSGMKHYISRGVPEFAWDGSVKSVLVIHRDITERKQVENVLHWSQAMLQMMSDSSPLGYLVVDNRTDDILYFNQHFCEIWGIQHLAERMRRGEMKNNDIIPDCLPQLADVLAFAASCKPLQDENNRVVVEDEIAFTNKRTIRRFSTQIRGEHDEYIGRFYIFEDISQRKQSEVRIKTLLNEKELLLKEVHHRIKNNMNTITSLLSLQAENHEDPSTQMALQDAAGRVQSMMVLYDELYQSQNFNALSFQDYIPSLLQRTVDLFPHRDSVQVQTQIENIVLPQKTLSSIGIILNELTTNAMKYAFMDRQDGIIRVCAVQTGGRVRLTFEDNGVGLPEQFTFENPPGFGIFLVGLLVQEINGTVSIEGGQGTRFVIEFDGE